MRIILLFIGTCLLGTIYSQTTYTTAQDGNWGDNSTWTGTAPPATLSTSDTVNVLHNVHKASGDIKFTNQSVLRIIDGTLHHLNGDILFKNSAHLYINNGTLKANGEIKVQDLATVDTWNALIQTTDSDENLEFGVENSGHVVVSLHNTKLKSEEDIHFFNGTFELNGGCAFAKDEIEIEDVEQGGRTFTASNFSFHALDEIEIEDADLIFHYVTLKSDEIDMDDNTCSGIIYSIKANSLSLSSTPCELLYYCINSGSGSLPGGKFSGSPTEDCVLANQFDCNNAPTSDDCDYDLLANSFDFDDDNDGILDTIEGHEDFDNDGIPNSCDLDSDNDGYVDVKEAGGSDPDEDGRIGTGSITDTDDDGVDDSVDANNGGTALTPANNDADANKDYLDYDSDQDGIPDLLEVQSTADFLFRRNEDLDRDGLDDHYDNYWSMDTAIADPAFFNGKYITPNNQDGDGEPDFRDLNSDNDGESDFLEAWDFDNNGIADITLSGLDTNFNGLDDKIDNLIALLDTLIDSTLLFQITSNQGPTTMVGYTGIGDEPNFRDGDIRVLLSCHLEGPYKGPGSPKMTSLLSAGDSASILGLNALTHPYTGAPWNHPAGEEISHSFFASHPGIVDWILIELRDKTTPDTLVAARACLLMDDGTTLDPSDGVSGALLPASSDSFYVVVRHRNHADIASLIPVQVSSGVITFDIRTSEANVFNGYLKQIGSDYVLYAADADANQDINANDKLIHNTQNGNFGSYLIADFNLDSDVNAIDVNFYYAINNGLILMLPF